MSTVHTDKKNVEISQNCCGLLRIYKLYLSKLQFQTRHFFNFVPFSKKSQVKIHVTRVVWVHVTEWRTFLSSFILQAIKWNIQCGLSRTYWEIKLFLGSLYFFIILGNIEPFIEQKNQKCINLQKRRLWWSTLYLKLHFRLMVHYYELNILRLILKKVRPWICWQQPSLFPDAGAQG